MILNTKIIQQMATCCKQVQCNKHLTLSKYYASVHFLEIIKYVNLDINIR